MHRPEKIIETTIRLKPPIENVPDELPKISAASTRQSPTTVIKVPVT
jgi:hypothetical protein